MAPKMLQKSSSGAGGPGRASGSDFGRFLEGPRGSPEAPESAPGAPGEPQEGQNEQQEAPNDPQEAPNDPQEGEKEPQEGQSELWEASGSVFGKDFRRISKQREATETLLTQTAGEGAQRPSKATGWRCGSYVFAAFLWIEPESSEKDARETHGCASWCFALLLLAVACARLLVFSVACDACGSRFSRASRSSIARLREAHQTHV